MKRFLVTYTHRLYYYLELGSYDEDKYKWFDTEELAKEFIKDKRNNKYSHFYLL